MNAGKITQLQRFKELSFGGKKKELLSILEEVKDVGNGIKDLKETVNNVKGGDDEQVFLKVYILLLNAIEYANIKADERELTGMKESHKAVGRIYEKEKEEDKKETENIEEKLKNL